MSFEHPRRRRRPLAAPPLCTDAEGRKPLDLDRGLPVTPEDVRAQRERRMRSAPMTFGEYLLFLQSFPPASPRRLRERGGPRGEPFSLPF